MRKGLLKYQQSKSPLLGQKIICPQGESLRSDREKSATLGLTSLVDAFAILVIYLLLHQVAEPIDFKNSKEIRLPVAQTTQVIEKGVKVTIKKGRYYVDDKMVSRDQLRDSIEKVMHSQKLDKLIVEADSKYSYAYISPVIVAGSQLGIEKLQLAVRQGARQ